MLNAAIRIVRTLDEADHFRASVDLWVEQVKVDMALVSGEGK
jgi:hypothetical protein